MLKLNYFHSKCRLTQGRLKTTNLTPLNNGSLEITEFPDFPCLVVEPLSSLSNLKYLKFVQGIYYFIIITASGLKSYFGSSSRIYVRLNQHINEAKNGSMDSPKLYNALRACGFNGVFLGVI